MSYVKPHAVESPKSRWRLRQVLHDGGEGGWSAAAGQWDNDGLWEEVLAIRWNGGVGSEIGNPQSRGVATWFIVPTELESAIRQSVATVQNRVAGDE